MVTHMKTTVEIADGLLSQARKVAAREKVTLRALLEEGLRQVLSARKARKRPFKLKDGSFRGKGFQPGFRGASWEQIRDEIYRGRGS